MALAAHLPTECKFPQVFSTWPLCESKAGHFHLMHVANEDGIGQQHSFAWFLQFLQRTAICQIDL